MSEAKANLDQAMADYNKEMDELKDDPIRAMKIAQVRNEMGPLASAKSAVSQAQERLKEAEENLESRLAGMQRERDRFERAEKAAIEEINKTYEGTTKANEVFTWFVRDGSITPAWSGVELSKKDGSVAKLRQDWSFTMRHLLQYRGVEHVRSALNVPAHVIPGQPPVVESTAMKAAPEANRPAGAKGQACYDAKLKEFRTGEGEEAPVSNDMMNEWRGECGLPAA
ncbi:hypothetical protein CY658_03075 [Variovorax sp. RO1]|nr:hypothetical protein CY658_03075 [Variovorax sp. RO1]